MLVGGRRWPLSIIPALAVRSFVLPAARQLTDAGYDVDLLRAPTWRGVPDLLTEYGRWAAERILGSGRTVGLIIGLSVGTQAAAVTASLAPVRRLLLVSPTVQPDGRSRRRLFGAWLSCDDHPDSPTLRQQAPDSAPAGRAPTNSRA